jgi:hypothetical protein
MPSTSPRATTSGPRSQVKRPGDLTGTRGQALAKERDEAQEAALAEAQAAKQDERVEKLNTVVDYTESGRPVSEVVEEEVTVNPKKMRIRVNYPIEQMTFGKEVISPTQYDEEGRVTAEAVLGGLLTYDFEEGVQYDVPFELGAHLKEKGYVYDF